MPKRKRNSDHGEYVDEVTGEVSIVQTTKQAKRAHQKSGKWYKEPTEAELRAWDREERRKAGADRAAKREENKKINAAKRAEKERKEKALKRQMYQAGKITFTQSLAKKDEDQKNLHSWFRGQPVVPVPKLPPASGGSDRASENKANSNRHNDLRTISDAVCDQTNVGDDEQCREQVRGLSQESIVESDDIESLMCEDFSKVEPLVQVSAHLCSTADQGARSNTMDQAFDQDLPDFEILEDDSAETVLLEQISDRPATDVFKVPALPSHAQRPSHRPPLSPMSPSDVNARNSRTTPQVSSFKSRLEDAKAETISSSQAVWDILAGICTQDLIDDLEDFDKENDEPDLETETLPINSPVKPTKHSSPPKAVLATKDNSNTTNLDEPFNSIDDSLFLEIDIAEGGPLGEVEDFDDCGLDDATLLSLPTATQLIAPTYKSVLSGSPTPIRKSDTASQQGGKERQPFGRNESFALEGLDEEDLIAGLHEFECNQKKSISASASTSISFLKKKRVLPWERPDWTIAADTAAKSTMASSENDDGLDIDDDGDIEMRTRNTEVFSSLG